MPDKPIYHPGHYMIRYYDENDSKIYSEKYTDALYEAKQHANTVLEIYSHVHSYKILHVIYDSKYNAHTNH